MPELDQPLNLPAPSTAPFSTSASILVIDDEAGIRESLEVLLTLEGYTVTMASDGEQGLRILELGNFDLVLLDLALPGQSGLELLPQIKERQPETAGHHDHRVRHGGQRGRGDPRRAPKTLCRSRGTTRS